MGEGLEGMAYGVYGMYGVYRVWDTGCGSGVAEYGVWDAGYGMRAVGCGLRFGRCEVRPRSATRMGRPAPAYISHQPSLPEVGVPSSQPRPLSGTTPPVIPAHRKWAYLEGGASAAGREEERGALRWRRRRCWSSSARSPCCPPTARRPSASCTPSVRPGAPSHPAGGSRPLPAASVPRHGRLLTHGAARPAGHGAAGGPEPTAVGGGRCLFGGRCGGAACGVGGSPRAVGLRRVGQRPERPQCCVRGFGVPRWEP